MELTTFLKINPADSVVVCLSAKQKGDIIEVDGKYFKDRTITLNATANEEGKIVTGWKVTGAVSKEVQGNELTLQMPNGNIAIEPIVSIGSGIEEIANSQQLMTNGQLYDLLGNKVVTPQTGSIYIQNGKKIIWR